MPQKEKYMVVITGEQKPIPKDNFTKCIDDSQNLYEKSICILKYYKTNDIIIL
jgi:hypothetical protein